ncbi:MAG: MFS transporter, partial [Micromonosporaceae bacterium]
MNEVHRPARTGRQRAVRLLLTVLFGALATVFAPAGTAQAAECKAEQWQDEWKKCAEQLPPANDVCLDPPTPSSPSSGLAGWFAERTKASRGKHNPGVYIDYGYAGYDFHTYGLRCGATAADVGPATENMIANWELSLASGVTGAANATRERAWDPGSMWKWADSMLENVTQTIYRKVFTAFGAITLGIVGLYLLWRSRQADMSDTMTTAGWAVLVMVVVTAVALYPVWAGNAADKTLTSTLKLVHTAAGPRPEALKRCNGDACADPRPPAERASEISTDAVLYRNWLRGTLGSSDSEAADKYGKALYDAQSFSWDEIEEIEAADPGQERTQVRDAIIKQKQDRFNRIAQQIKKEDREAYEHLQGLHGSDRVGAGFIALMSAVFFGFFDLVASLLILLSFMIIRWAVIIAPLLGTIALLRPASAGLRRLGNAVVAAVFGVVLFGAGAAIYLLAVQAIMKTTMAPWLHVVLVGLAGVAGWLLLRPYRRLTQLAGGSGGSLSDRVLGRRGDTEREPGPDPVDAQARPESRTGGTILVPTAAREREPTRVEGAPGPSSRTGT